MKKLLYIFLLFPLLFLPSCVKEEGSLFDGSAAERMARALNEYNRILNAAPDGWIMEYYSESTGGFNYLCKFETLDDQLNGYVNVASELDLDEYPAGETFESLYELKQDQSAILTFNTYNPLLHYFSEPYPGNRQGLGGDYEFTFIKANEDSIILRGKKHGDRIVMTPFRGTDWTAWLQKVITLQNECIYATFDLYLNGKYVCPAVMNDDRWISFPLRNNAIEQRFIYTATGINLYEPVTINGAKMKFFDWDKTKNEFRCTNRNVDAVMKLALPSDYLLYEDFLGTYRFEYNEYTNTARVSKTVTVTEKVPGQTYSITGLSSMNIEMTYSKGTGAVSIHPQQVGVDGDVPVYLWVWDIQDGWITADPSRYFPAKWNKKTDDFVLTFQDNGNWAGYKIEAFILLLDNDDMDEYNPPSRYIHPTMIKQ